MLFSYPGGRPGAHRATSLKQKTLPIWCPVMMVTENLDDVPKIWICGRDVQSDFEKSDMKSDAKV